MTGRLYHNDNCKNRAWQRRQREKTKAALQAAKPAQLPLIEQPKRDERDWRERMRDILSKRDPVTKRYGDKK